MFFFRRPAVDERLGLVVTRDGRWIKTTTARGTERFTSSDPAGFLRAIQAAVDKVDLVSSATELDGKPLQFTTAEFDQLRLAVALHWARYCLSTRTAIDVQPEDLDHPQTWDIVLSTAQDKYGDSAEALALAAHVLRTSVERLAQWRRVEDDRISHM